MGMAASQARYLSLSARKTNTEYEGQQLNQQRLNLANQSADLFNQMLTMSVPVCPDSNNFTTLQYTYNDGLNDEVISDVYQISVPNEEYNYVVSSYRFENVYTGQAKKMNSPEIQAAKKNMFTRKPDKDYTVNQLTYHAESVPGAGDDSYTIVVSRNDVESTHIFRRMDKSIDSVEEIDAFTNRTSEVTGVNAQHTPADPSTNPPTPATWTFDEAITFTDVKISVPNFSGPMNPPDDMPYDEVDITIPAGAEFTQIDFEDENDRDKIAQLMAVYGDKYDPTKTYYAVDTNVTDAAGNPVYAFICGEDVAATVGSQGDMSKIEVRTGDNTTYYTDGKYILTAGELAAINVSEGNTAIFFHREENNPTYSNFTAVGNCELNDVTIDQYNANEEMQIEIQQVLSDMKGTNSTAYSHLAACFDSVTGEYMGGIYSFKMFGHTYYTTTADLEEAVKGAYQENATASNGIDSQNKLMYYTSTYIKTKIEETRKALLETDGRGRFSSAKFEDDSTVYTLSCETITDEDAYQDAMNKYFYKQEQYDKAIADINAKNEIIQAEDRQLQLRLEQLGTEQTALQTEMEACQKVVSKSIDSTFKTFGG